MRTRARLDQVFNNSFPVPFDDNSKFVFFSDVHRGNDSLSDEFGRNRHIYYHALNYYYNGGFSYFEIGDGDELWENTKFEYILNAHTGIFRLLKKYYNDDRLYMLYGNHNMQLEKQDYVKKNYYHMTDEYSEIEEDLFPGIVMHEGLILKHRKTGQEVFLVHGNQGDLLNDQMWVVSFVAVRFLWRFLHIAGVKYAASPAKNRQKRHRIEKNFSKWADRTGIAIICGHTHRPKFPSPSEAPYFNCGCCIHPRGIQCLELIYGKIALVNWTMSTRDDGTVFIKRSIMKGPEPLINFSKNELNIDYSQEFKNTKIREIKNKRRLKKEAKRKEETRDRDE